MGFGGGRALGCCDHRCIYGCDGSLPASIRDINHTEGGKREAAGTEKKVSSKPSRKVGVARGAVYTFKH